jgi:hypothetical protein
LEGKRITEGKRIAGKLLKGKERLKRGWEKVCTENSNRGLRKAKPKRAWDSARQTTETLKVWAQRL